MIAHTIDLAGARAFFRKNGPMMLKAVAGGGGRGMRIVRTEAEIARLTAITEPEPGLPGRIAEMREALAAL